MNECYKYSSGGFWNTPLYLYRSVSILTQSPHYKRIETNFQDVINYLFYEPLCYSLKLNF